MPAVRSDNPKRLFRVRLVSENEWPLTITDRIMLDALPVSAAAPGKVTEYARLPAFG